MTIGEFSEITGICPSTLRYYESRGLIRVSRDGAGRRDYSREDIGWAEFLQRLKSTGMSLEGMKKYSLLRYEGDSTVKERFELLSEHRKYVADRIKHWQECLEKLDRKMEYYENVIIKSEK